MKVKDTINFKILREKGPAAIEISGEEVVQLVSSKKEILCIVRQEYLLQLESAYSNLLVRQGLKEQQLVDISSPSLMRNFTQELGEIRGLAQADAHEFSKKPPKFFGSANIKSTLQPSMENELEALKKKISQLETNHPELFKEKKK